MGYRATVIEVLIYRVTRSRQKRSILCSILSILLQIHFHISLYLLLRLRLCQIGVAVLFGSLASVHNGMLSYVSSTPPISVQNGCLKITAVTYLSITPCQNFDSILASQPCMSSSCGNRSCSQRIQVIGVRRALYSHIT